MTADEREKKPNTPFTMDRFTLQTFTQISATIETLRLIDSTARQHNILPIIYATFETLLVNNEKLCHITLDTRKKPTE